jgi:hypothetical protein
MAKSSAAEPCTAPNTKKYFCGGRTAAPDKTDYFSRKKDLHMHQLSTAQVFRTPRDIYWF